MYLLTFAPPHYLYTLGSVHQWLLAEYILAQVTMGSELVSRAAEMLRNNMRSLIRESFCLDYENIGSTQGCGLSEWGGT